MNKADEIPVVPEANAEAKVSDPVNVNERSVSEDEMNSSSAAPPPKKIGTKRNAPIDETLLDEEEKKKLEARRAYNRKCAAKARKRSKDLISHLQKQVEELTRDKATLERNNEVMRAQLELLEQQNRILMMNQRQGMQGGSAGSSQSQFLLGSAGAGNYQSIPLLDALNAQGRMPGPQGSQGAAALQQGMSMQSRTQQNSTAVDSKKFYGLGN